MLTLGVQSKDTVIQSIKVEGPKSWGDEAEYYPRPHHLFPQKSIISWPNQTTHDMGFSMLTLTLYHPTKN